MLLGGGTNHKHLYSWDGKQSKWADPNFPEGGGFVDVSDLTIEAWDGTGNLRRAKFGAQFHRYASTKQIGFDLKGEAEFLFGFEGQKTAQTFLLHFKPQATPGSKTRNYMPTHQSEFMVFYADHWNPVNGEYVTNNYGFCYRLQTPGLFFKVGAAAGDYGWAGAVYVRKQISKWLHIGLAASESDFGGIRESEFYPLGVPMIEGPWNFLFQRGNPQHPYFDITIGSHGGVKFWNLLGSVEFKAPW